MRKLADSTIDKLKNVETDVVRMGTILLTGVPSRYVDAGRDVKLIECELCYLSGRHCKGCCLRQDHYISFRRVDDQLGG